MRRRPAPPPLSAGGSGVGSGRDVLLCPTSRRRRRRVRGTIAARRGARGSGASARAARGPRGLPPSMPARPARRSPRSAGEGGARRAGRGAMCDRGLPGLQHGGRGGPGATPIFWGSPAGYPARRLRPGPARVQPPLRPRRGAGAPGPAPSRSPGAWPAKSGGVGGGRGLVAPGARDHVGEPLGSPPATPASGSKVTVSTGWGERRTSSSRRSPRTS